MVACFNFPLPWDVEIMFKYFSVSLWTVKMNLQRFTAFEALITKVYFIKIPSCAQALDSLHPTGKMSPRNFYPLPLAKQQFSYYNTIKNSFLAVVVVPVPGHTNFGFTDVQYLHNGVFSIENSLNGQNHFLTDFHHPMKKSLPSPKFPIPPLVG